ncbi:hypothetical protein IDH44_23140 [Paenibacillus sp. IB182496]|uniref:Uncharacterized protein n=1 Tax=Paenibacillus sabuli TaxID=2772509 RepID=A0A927GTY3_9BACL|nr:hypothetical protein [Paenibacillus sabuli]
MCRNDDQLSFSYTAYGDLTLKGREGQPTMEVVEAPPADEQLDRKFHGHQGVFRIYL